MSDGDGYSAEYPAGEVLCGFMKSEKGANLFVDVHILLPKSVKVIHGLKTVYNSNANVDNFTLDKDEIL